MANFAEKNICEFATKHHLVFENKSTQKLIFQKLISVKINVLKVTLSFFKEIFKLPKNKITINSLAL